MVRRAFARHLQSLADTGTRSGPLSGPSARPGRRFTTSATIILAGTGAHAATCEIVKSHCSRPTSQTLIDRIMGHAAKGTGPRNYNRRELAVGVVRALRELLDLLVNEMPAVTEHVPRQATVNLLPLYDRSRVGSAKSRDVSRYFLLNEAEIGEKRSKQAEATQLVKAGM
jgi:hypothetical protein